MYTKENYVTPAMEETPCMEEGVLCVSTGTNDWIVDPNPLVF